MAMSSVEEIVARIESILGLSPNFSFHHFSNVKDSKKVYLLLQERGYHVHRFTPGNQLLSDLEVSKTPLGELALSENKYPYISYPSQVLESVQ